MDAWLILLIGGSVGLVAGAVIGYARSRGSGRGPGGRDVLVGAVVGAMVGLAGSGVVFSEGRSRTSAADLVSESSSSRARQVRPRALPSRLRSAAYPKRGPTSPALGRHASFPRILGVQSHLIGALTVPDIG